MIRLLPWLAALAIVLLMIWSGCEAVAGASSDDDRWVAEALSSSLAPLPSSVPRVLVAPVDVAGVEAGGTWDGETIRVSEREPIYLFHELGHAFDDRDLDEDERRRLLPRLGYGPRATWSHPRRWEMDPFCQRIRCPEERFANVYAGCALGVEPYWSARDKAATAKVFASLCRMIDRFARSNTEQASLRK